MPGEDSSREERRRSSRHTSSSPEKRDRAGAGQDRERDREQRREKHRSSTRDGEKRRSQATTSEDKVRDEKRRSHASSDERRRSRRHSSSSPEKKSKPRAHVTERVVDSRGSESNSSGSNALSFEALAKLNAINAGRIPAVEEKKRDKGGNREDGQGEQRYRSRHHEAAAAILEERRRKKRVVSAGEVEKGGSSEDGEPNSRRFTGFKKPNFAAFKENARKRKWSIVVAIFVLVLVIIIPVAVVESKKNDSGTSGSIVPGSTPSQINGQTPQDVPDWAKGTYYDPFLWYDLVDFNATITNETVGGLPIMGLNSTWDDSVAANDNVPALDKEFKYGTMPIRGVNVGGWLSIEPFITPSLFDQFPQSANVVDEYTLTAKLGSGLAATQLEKHYSSFINAQSFQDIRDAGFDHVRIPYSYWAVTTYDGDPYVKQISWRYLLRGIEYARQNGLRVNLDLHALPGSQNGWNHSGRQGVIGWLNGTDGDLNAQRSIELHDQLSQFFAQPRYKNVVAIYGLVNEPKMISLPLAPVLNWTTVVTQLVQKNGITAHIAFGDGFLGLNKWKGQLSGLKNLVLDAHQYIIFNIDQIAFDHDTKLAFACNGWAGQTNLSMNTATGFGPTLCGEWSQADTDCATYLNNVNVGSRWEGTLNIGDPSANVLQPKCPLKTSQCSCNDANADPGSYSPLYKAWLYDNAVASMISFEYGWGWFYWTWMTEKSVQWSWKLGMDAGILPKKVWDRGGTGPDGNAVYNCQGQAPSFAPTLPENY